MWERWFKPKPQPLTGAPAVRRQKTYSAASGYVYQYFYQGQRPYTREGDAGTEYVFEVSADRKTSFPIAVLVGASALQTWESRHGRALHPSERYAIAKMALFQAFDERPDPAALAADVRLRPADVEAILANLGIE